MLYVLYGTDTDTSRKKVKALISGLLKKKPDAEHFLLTSETFSPDISEEYILGQGLFSNTYIVLLDRVCEETAHKDIVIDKLKDIAGSDNIFFLLETDLDAKTKKKFEKHAEKITEYSFKTKTKKNEFNVFALTDALGKRDKKKLWILYQEALRAGKTPEELHGLLYWQIKTMLLVEQGATKTLKPFVVNKTKKFIDNYSKEELLALSHDFVELYHDARLGKVEFGGGLERVVLGV